MPNQSAVICVSGTIFREAATQLPKCGATLCNVRGTAMATAPNASAQ